MGRPRKTVEVPGQEPVTGAEPQTGATSDTVVQEQPRADQQVITVEESQFSEEALLLTARNTLLATLNEQGAAIIARFEDLGFTDLADQQLTDNPEFLHLVKKATDVVTGDTGPMVTNEEGKKQPVTGKPVLTQHGWHVPG